MDFGRKRELGQRTIVFKGASATLPKAHNNVIVKKSWRFASLYDYL